MLKISPFWPRRQHMFMAHCSSMRCKRCWKLLKESELSAHEAQKSCRKKPCPYPYQITDLRHIRAIRFQGEDFDKWYILYEALFPNVPKQLLPKTPCESLWLGPETTSLLIQVQTMTFHFGAHLYLQRKLMWPAQAVRFRTF